MAIRYNTKRIKLPNKAQTQYTWNFNHKKDMLIILNLANISRLESNRLSTHINQNVNFATALSMKYRFLLHQLWPCIDADL